jgi:predicted amidohydrolase
VRKESLPAFEGWYFKSCDEPKIIETDIGHIAIGICHDNHTARFFRRVMRDSPDLILMPHSAPCVPGGASLMRERLREIAQHYARAFGVPVVLVNKVRGRSRSPVPGVPLLRVQFDFPGLSSICDSDGNVVESLGDLEGVAVGDVTLDPARKLRPAGPGDSYWAQPASRFARMLGAFFAGMERLGIRAYERSASRRVAARNMALAGSEGRDPAAERHPVAGLGIEG